MSTDHPHVEDILPEGGIPIASFRAVVYIDPEGQEAYSLGWGTNQSILTTLGLLDVARSQFVEEMEARS